MTNKRTLKFILFILTTVLFVGLSTQSRLTEDISALLPKGNNEAMDITFRNLKVKDKIFIQCVSDDEQLQDEALNFFLAKADSLDADDYIESILYRPDVFEMLDAAHWMADHAPAYLDFEDAELDSLTSVDHIRQTIRTYNAALETDEGAAVYEFMGYDPAGIAISKVSRIREALASNGRAKGIAYITPRIGTTQSREAARLVRTLRQAKALTLAQYDVDILFHGQIINSAGNGSRIRRDLMTTITISLAFALLLLGICFGRVKYVGLLLLPIGYGMAFAMASIYLIQGGMSLMSLGIGAIVLGVAMSYVMHVMIHYLYTGDREQTVRAQRKPVLMGSITTIGAFAGLLFTESPLLRDFGLFALLTVAGTTFAALFFLPEFFPREYTPNKRAFAFLERINASQIDRRSWLVALVVLLTVGAITMCNRYQFDTDLLHIGYLSNDTKTAQARWAAVVNGGAKQQYYAAMSSDLDEALQISQAISTECESLKGDSLISMYMPVHVLMPSLELQELRLGHWELYHTPEKQAEIWRHVEAACAAEDVDAEWFAPYRDLMMTPPAPELLAEAEVVPDYLMENLIEQVGPYYMVFTPVRMPEQNLRAVNERLTDITGCVVLDPFYYATSLVEMTHRDFNRIMLISSIFVLLLLLFTYRNLWVALIAYTPVIMSWYAVLGAMAIAGQSFNILNIVVSSFVFGIGVDYSIFIMDGLLHGQPKTDNTQTNPPETDSPQSHNGHSLLTMHKTAITLSALVLVLCMASLLFAKHPAIHSIAFCSLYGMITTMLLSYTLQPVLYRWYKRIKK